LTSRAPRRKTCAKPIIGLQSALVKARSIFSLCVLLPVIGLMGGCATKGSSDTAAVPATQKKGHWVTLPPETGSMIPRRIWVEDNGQANAAPSMNNLQNGSAADMQRLQNSSSNSRHGGS